MKPPPAGWPRISVALFYDDPVAAIDWLCKAFGFEVRIKVVSDEGRLEHSELTFGGGLIMVSGTVGKGERMPYARTPSQAGGGNTQGLMVYVDDVEAHCARARAAGGRITKEPETHDYGEDHWSDRSYECRDVGGHHWWFAERLRSAPGA